MKFINRFIDDHIEGIATLFLWFVVLPFFAFVAYSIFSQIFTLGWDGWTSKLSTHFSSNGFRNWLLFMIVLMLGAPSKKGG